ncbi:MAG: hypothetical protein HY376_02905 [Candidatus Blackburnbacteria bacterium]|nr:hypothetical protein [Candidatus Blackburnbacteria bacterium]
MKGKKGISGASLLRVAQIVALVVIVLVLALKGFHDTPQQAKVTDFRLTCQNVTSSEFDCWNKQGTVRIMINSEGKTKLTPQSYCDLNANDNATCRCTKRMNAHVRFFDEFNTTPELLQIIRDGNWSTAYPSDKKVVEDIGQSVGGGFSKIKMSNVSKDYYLTYNYEEVDERCIEAEAR